MQRPSAGMQYVQRSEQALVIDTRRSRAMRPNLSTRNGVSGRPTVERARWRTVGMPSATGHMVTDFFSMLAGGGEVARWGVLFHSVVGTVARFHPGDSSPAVMGKFRAGPGDQRESSRNIVGGVQPEKTEGAMYVVHYSRIRGTPAWTR